MTKDEAIKQIEWVKKRISDITYSPESFEALNLAIKALEERPTGEWIEIGKYQVECTQCHYDDCAIKSNYCPNCGAKMQEAENE